MKKLQVLILFFCNFYSFGQTSIYHQFPDSNAVWRMQFSDQGCYFSGIPRAEFRYVLNGDTTFGSDTYKKISRDFGQPYPACTPPFQPNNNSGYIGGIREDTITRRVYFLETGTVQEILLYDFSLGVGDSVPANLHCMWGMTDGIVTQIDSILIGSTYRKLFITDRGINIIEGVGFVTGLFEASILDVWPFLNCYSENGAHLYIQSGIVSCDLITGENLRKVVEEHLSVFPNPVEKTVSIRIDNELVGGSLMLIDHQGKVRYRQQLNQMEHTINLSNLPSGIYSVWVSKDHRLSTVRLAVQR